MLIKTKKVFTIKDINSLNHDNWKFSCKTKIFTAFHQVKNFFYINLLVEFKIKLIIDFWDHSYIVKAGLLDFDTLCVKIIYKLSHIV